MGFRLQYRRYRLPFRVPVRTAQQLWSEREGFLLRLENESGAVGYGEAAPIPAFGTEAPDEAEAALRVLGDAPTREALEAVPPEFAGVRHALMDARDAIDAVSRGSEHPTVTTAAHRAVAALLPAGRAALEALPPKIEIGFRVFKWKVGVAPIADELSLLDDVCAALPSGAKLRLDANGAWDRRQAERWLERCADRPIEFVEQPCFAPKSAGETSGRRIDDVLLGLAHDYPTPIALDESVVSEGDVGRWLDLGWRGWFVIKPSLLGNPRVALDRLATAKATVVFSSALETAVGAKSALQHAFRWTGEAKALGFGVWPLFADARFDGPISMPFWRAEDVAHLNPETLWNALP